MCLPRKVNGVVIFGLDPDPVLSLSKITPLSRASVCLTSDVNSFYFFLISFYLAAHPVTPLKPYFSFFVEKFL